MRIYYFFFIISSFSVFSQKKDILIIDGNKYEGEIIEYFNKDFKYGNSGYILFDNGLGQDTIIISRKYCWRCFCYSFRGAGCIVLDACNGDGWYDN